MLFERPRSSGSFSLGPPSTLGEVFEASVEAGRYVDNVNASVRGLEEAYDARIDAIKKATGVALRNPFRSAVGSTGGAFGVEQETGDPFAFFQAELERLATNRPEHREVIAPHRPVAEAARAKARSVDDALADVAARSPSSGAAVMAAQLAGGVRASLEDPINWAAMAAGPTGRVGVGARQVLWMGVKAGAANAAVEAGLQPVIQGWRKEAGLDYGVGHAAMNIAAAGVLGGALDAGLRSAYRGAQRGAGRVPVLDADGKVTGYRPANDPGGPADGQMRAGVPTLQVSPDDALEAAARAAPDGSLLRRASDGDVGALDELSRALGIADDPAVRGARQALELEPGDARVAGVDDGEGLDQLIAGLRHAHDPDANPPARGADAVPEARGAVLSDAVDAPSPLGRAFEKDGKPVTFRAFKPDELAADPATFQFRRQVNTAGTTGRMSGIETWDPMASGKVVVFQRLSGELVIADGHHRLELARRLADQSPELQGYLFREVDGWSPADVRAYAAKKNMMDSPRVDPVDAAAALRARPDLIDSSVAVGDETMRQARALAKLSDEAFGMTVGGVLPPNFAALVGDLVPDKSRHASLMAELAGIAPANVREARFALAELMALPVHAEEQMSLLGVFRFERSLMKERMGVLDVALKSLRDDRRVFGLLEREAGRIEGAGNRLDEAANAARAEGAARVAGLIEQLAVSRGPVSDWLNEAARAVASGSFSKRMAAEAFARRVADTFERDGLNGLTAEAAPLRAGGFDEPLGPEAQAQVKGLEAQLAREIEAATKPDKAAGPQQAREQAVLFDASQPVSRTERAAERWDAITKGLVETVKMLPRDVRMRVEERLVLGDREVAGFWDGYERLVYVSMTAQDPVRTARHEVVHALRQSGLMTDAEFDTLYRFAVKLGLREAYDIDRQYKDLYGKAFGDRGGDYVEALLREEVVANMFSDYSLNGRRFGSFDGGGAIDQIIGEIVKFMKAVRDMLGRHGFRDVTDIFQEIESGAMALRAMREVEMPGGGSIYGLQLLAIKGYHGTPHTFAPEPGYPFGRFRLDRIGTGEGAQAYGHGLYFAENESVARSYKDELGGGGSKIVADSPISGELRAWLDKYPDVDVARMMLEMRRDKPGVSELIDEINRLSGARAVPSNGHLYEVRINADPEDFLDWDKPLSQQSEKVKAKLGVPATEKAVEAERLATEIDRMNRVIDGHGSGRDPRPDEAMRIKDGLVRQYLEIDPTESAWWKFDTKDAAARPDSAQKLREAGIPGIRYLDQGSRTAGEGSRNYVVFDDRLIEIVAVDGRPVVSLGDDLAGVERIGDVKDVVESCK